jgi:predicted ABC-type sugar transport system permease subunit
MSGASKAVSARWRFAALEHVDKSLWLPVGVVLGLAVFFGVATDSFATLRNFSAITGQAGTLLIVCLGSTFVVLMGSIDLSIGAVVLLVGASSVMLLNATHLGLGIIPLAAALGGLLGVANGLIYVFGRIPSFVVTLGSLSVFTGVALQILQGRAIQFDNPDFEEIAIGQLIHHLPNIALCALLAWIIVVFVADRTRLGRYMYIIGAHLRHPSRALQDLRVRPIGTVGRGRRYSGGGPPGRRGSLARLRPVVEQPRGDRSRGHLACRRDRWSAPHTHRCADHCDSGQWT